MLLDTSRVRQETVLVHVVDVLVFSVSLSLSSKRKALAQAPSVRLSLHIGTFSGWTWSMLGERVRQIPFYRIDHVLSVRECSRDGLARTCSA